MSNIRLRCFALRISNPLFADHSSHVARDIVRTIFHIREDEARFRLRQKSYLSYASIDGILDTLL